MNPKHTERYREDEDEQKASADKLEKIFKQVDQKQEAYFELSKALENQRKTAKLMYDRLILVVP
jgi:hypothetical protein